jgi:hypothetical protein
MTQSGKSGIRHLPLWPWCSTLHRNCKNDQHQNNANLSYRFCFKYFSFLFLLKSVEAESMKKLKAAELTRVLLAELSCEPCRFDFGETCFGKAGTYATVTILLYFLRDQDSSLRMLVRTERYNISLRVGLLLEALLNKVEQVKEF